MQKVSINQLSEQEATGTGAAEEARALPCPDAYQCPPGGRRLLPKKRTFFYIGMEKALDPSKNVITGTLSNIIPGNFIFFCLLT